MKYSLLILLSFSLLPIVGFSQQRLLKKTQSKLDNNKLDKAYKLASKGQQRYPKMAIFRYYKAAINYRNAIMAEKQQRIEVLLNKAATEFYMGLRHDVDSSGLAPFRSQYTAVHDSLQRAAHRYFSLDKPDKAKKLVGYLIKYYGDSVPQLSRLLYGADQSAGLPPLAVNDSLQLLRKQILAKAQDLLGVKYSYGGEDPQKGFDCSGFVKFVYQQVTGLELPHNANLQSKLGNSLDINDAEPGDLIFFGSRGKNNKFSAYHAGVIYAQLDTTVELIHCVNRGVKVDGPGDSAHTHWMGRDYKVVRILGIEPQELLTVFPEK